MFSCKQCFLITFIISLCSSISLEELKVPLNPTSIGYHIEFEVVSYDNPEGRLASGECCSGYKSTLGHGICRGGNASCHPYWKICVTHQQTDPSKSNDLSMPIVERRSGVGGLSAFRTEPKGGQLLKRNKPPQTRQSLFKGLFNRIVNSFKGLGSSSSPTVNTNSTVVKNKTNVPSSPSSPPTPSPCSIAYWSTDGDRKKGSIKLRATIPLVNMVKGFQSDLTSLSRDSTVNRSTSSATTQSSSSTSPSSSPSTTVELNPLQQRVVLLVEIWHKARDSSTGADKLIARHLEMRNTTLQLTPLEEEFWEYGGPNYSSPNITSGIKFRYRWRITGSFKYSDDNIIPDCPPGFRGDNCDQPICKSGCHATHGYCNEPNECKCKFGWTGELCSLCVPMPGCIHGSCSKPFECRCEEGWSGMFCDKPTCKPGCHPQNGYCEHPGECRCRFGYQGDNCTECATMPGCQNGDCENPLDCNCYKGWTGLFCNIPICSEGCDLEHGWCRRPSECRCRIGWAGSNCTECVPYPGCQNGNCTQPWTCDCQPGWGGIACTERLDYCETNESPCFNGGTCISLEKADGSFLCRCPLGFEGKRCERTK